jgi:protein-tyrosine phosphatase
LTSLSDNDIRKVEQLAIVARDYLLDNYNRYLFLYAKAYRRIFDRLLDGDRIIIHCTAGKDRASLASAMVLRTLCVPEETVLADYMLTNKYWGRGDRERPGRLF